MNTLARTTFGIAIAIAAATLVAGCGGGGSTPPATTGGTGGEPPAASPTVLPSLAAVRIASAASTGRAMATLQDGTQVAVWSDDTGIFSQRFSPAGLVGSRLQIAATGYSLDGVTALATAGYVVEYHQPSIVLVQVVGGDGQLAGAAATVMDSSDITGTNSLSVDAGTGVVAASDGTFLAGAAGEVLSSRGGVLYNFYERKFDAAGKTVGAPVNIASAFGLGNFAAAALPAGNFAFAFPGVANETTLALYDSNLRQKASVAGGSLYNTGQQIAVLSNGSFALLFNGGPSVNAQVYRYDALTSAVTRVVDKVYLPTPQRPYHAHALPDSHLLVTWNGTHGQLFDANLQPTSSEWLIGSETVAPLPDGRVSALVQQASELDAVYYKP